MEGGEKGGGRGGEIGKEGMRGRLLQVSVALIILTSDVLVLVFCLFISGSLCSLESIVRRVKTYWRK